MSVARIGAAVAFAVLLVAGALTAALSASAWPRSGTAETYTDRTGDGTPDISAIVIGHDDGGALTLALTAVDLGTAVAADTRRDFDVFLEPDDDTSPAAPPYDLLYEEWPGGTACQLLKDNGTSYWPVAAGVSCAKSGDTVVWTLARGDIGAREMFSFFVVSGLVSTSGSVLGVDRAPELGRWRYDLVAATTTSTATAVPAVTPVIGRPNVTPARPVAGGLFRVVFPVTRSDTGAPLAAATMRCDPTIAGRLVPHREQFTRGRAQVSIQVPAGAKGRTLRVQLRITSRGRAATRVASFRVFAH